MKLSGNESAATGFEGDEVEENLIEAIALGLKIEEIGSGLASVARVDVLIVLEAGIHDHGVEAFSMGDDEVFVIDRRSRNGFQLDLKESGMIFGWRFEGGDGRSYGKAKRLQIEEADLLVATALNDPRIIHVIAVVEKVAGFNGKTSQGEINPDAASCEEAGGDNLLFLGGHVMGGRREVLFFSIALNALDEDLGIPSASGQAINDFSIRINEGGRHRVFDDLSGVAFGENT